MSTCPTCHKPVIRALLGGAIPVLLDPEPGTYSTVDPDPYFPTDGTRVFLNERTYVDHAAVCPKKTVPQRQLTKKGAAK